MSTTTDPKCISVSCCAECPFRDPEFKGNEEHRVLECHAPVPIVALGYSRETDADSRPVWCPLPILVTAEGE